jgi:hypothetical protein
VKDVALGAVRRVVARTGCGRSEKATKIYLNRPSVQFHNAGRHDRRRLGANNHGSINGERAMISTYAGKGAALLTMFLLGALVVVPGQAAEEEQIVIEDLTPAQLRDEIEKIQTEFYAVFNRNNSDDAFDVVCQKFTPTGSNIPQTGCEPGFVTARRGENANNYRLGTDELLTQDALMRELQPQFAQLTEKMNALAAADQYFRELGQILQMLNQRLKDISL